jgi:serine/threonine-protein kinase HipA
MMHDAIAGYLSETENGYLFEYDSSYIATPGSEAVSLTLPLATKPYLSKN